MAGELKMTQKEMSELLEVPRSTLATYLKKYGKKSKECTVNDINELRIMLNGENKKEVTKKIEKKVALKVDPNELKNTKDKNYILVELKNSYNLNRVIINDCVQELLKFGSFTFNKFGESVPNKAIKLKAETEKSQREIIKLINDLEKFEVIEEEEEFDYGSLD